MLSYMTKDMAEHTLYCKSGNIKLYFITEEKFIFIMEYFEIIEYI